MSAREDVLSRVRSALAGATPAGPVPRDYRARGEHPPGTDLNEVRVEISTFRLPDARAFAMIEGADGDFNSRILRGYFSRPLGRRFMMQAGLDLSQSQGFRRLDPFSINTLMGRLS